MEDKLATIFDKYGSPDPKYIEHLPKGGTTLDFIGHARITQWLLEIDPEWTIEPVAFDEGGLPARVKHGNMVQAGFYLTLCGHRRYCVGSVEDRKADIGKELVSDGIRNGAMRFGLATTLWSKLPLGEDPVQPAPAKKTVKKTAAKKTAAPAPEVSDDELVDPATIGKFKAACDLNGLSQDEVAQHAGVNLNRVTLGDMDALRASFKTLKEQMQ
jgi:hypothetical protein